MRAAFKDQLEFALTKAAKAGPRPWAKLKAELVSIGFAQEVLEEHHIVVADIFLDCLAKLGDDSSPYYPKSKNRSRSPRLPSPSAASLQSSELSSRSRYSKKESSENPVRKPTEGWIELTEGTREKRIVNFSFDPEPGNFIGTHIIDRYATQLRPRIVDDMIELVICLDSQPGRTHSVKCGIEESQIYDILLGQGWNSLIQGPNTQSSKMRKKRRDQTEKDSTSAQLPSLNVAMNNPNSTSPPISSPEFLARFLKELSNPSTPLSSAVPKVSRRTQNKQPGFDTDPEPLIRARRPPRVRSDASPWDSLGDEKPEQGPDGFAGALARKRAGRSSEASTTSDQASQIFDDHYQGDESEESEVTDPDLSSPDVGPDVQAASDSPFSASFLLAIDECWKVDPTPQPSEYEYDYE